MWKEAVVAYFKLNFRHGGWVFELWVGVTSGRELREMPLATLVQQLGRFRVHVDLSFM
jgi:hypothetical protein